MIYINLLLRSTATSTGWLLRGLEHIRHTPMLLHEFLREYPVLTDCDGYSQTHIGMFFLHVLQDDILLTQTTEHIKA